MNGKIRRLIVAAALMAVLAISGISAYFTDGDTATNIFTVGNVQIDLQETVWWPDAATEITPGQEFFKDPMVKNIGTNHAYVFMEVVVPYVDVVIADEEGNKKTSGCTELFSYNLYSDFWEELETTRDEVNKTVTHLYAFVQPDNRDKMEFVPARGGMTPLLFDTIKFENVVEDQNLEGRSLDVVINAYAIQTDNINDGKTAPAEVWAVLSTQAPTTAMPDGVTEDPVTDVIS